MTFIVKFRPAARAEFDEAIDWYESREAGLGDEFEDAIVAAVEKIRWNPNSRALVYKVVRKIAVDQFPYIVFYRVRGDVIRIVSVFHSKRDPKIWKARV